MSEASGPKKPPDDARGELAMEDILASIRRILKEDEEPGTRPTPERDDVLLLDDSMMVSEPKPAAPLGASSSATTPATPAPTQAPPQAPEAPPPEKDEDAAPSPLLGHLLAPEAAAATAASLGSLMQTLVSERGTLVHRSAQPGGPTIEEMVREELRPFLKAWLDQHLPALVERVVRAEIDRLLGSSLP